MTQILQPSSPTDPFTDCCLGDYHPSPEVQVLSNRFITAYTDRCPRISLRDMLETAWEDGVHFTQYTSALEVRLRKLNQPPTDLAFGIAAFDLDWAEHSDSDLPTAADFANLCRTCWVIDESPNILYHTKHGARIIYRIEPISDPAVFEAHYIALMHRLSIIFRRASGKYDVDCGCKDWTRLFLAPYVQRDGVAYDSCVRQIHDGILNLLDFAVREKPAHKVLKAQQRWLGVDPKLDYRLSQIKPGQRNRKTFAAACYILRNYKDPDKPLARLYGLEEPDFTSREIDTCIASARQSFNYEQP